MTTQHTPGPWDIFPKDDTLEIGNYGANAPLVRLSATVPTNDWEGWANARLIASAPDLLSALEDAIEELKHAAYIVNLRQDVIESCKATIAKARGGQA